MRRSSQLALIALLVAGATACSGGRAERSLGRRTSGGLRSSAAPAAKPAGASAITAREIGAHLRFLAADALEGRAVGSRGLQLAALYHETVFRRLGLRGAFAGGSYRQPLSLRGSRPDPRATLRFSVAGRTLEPEILRDFVVNTHRRDQPDAVAGPLVYAGYLIQAPASRWDDVKGADLAGKVLLVEVNEPGNERGGIFDGRAMTYYGRWTYKFEQAERLGALGVLIIHSTRDATYGWDVVRNSWSKESFFLPGKKRSLGFHGWISRQTAVKLLRAAGLDRDQLKQRAQKRSFRPVATQIVARVRQHARFRTVQSENVAAILDGRDRDDPDGRRYVVVSAHYDHLGRDAQRSGDQIFNGAVDNCAASATMLALARHLASGPRPPSSVIFLAATAEEVGLLGSRFFVQNPPVERTKLVANINLELTNVWGPTRDVYAIGAAESDLQQVCRAAAERAGLRYVAERGRENGFFYRSDQLSFARGGVPGVWLHEGPTARGEPADRIRKAREHYQRSVYHTVGDDLRQVRDLTGAVQIGRWAAAIVEQLGERSGPVRFHQGSAFRRRDGAPPARR